MTDSMKFHDDATYYCDHWPEFVRHGLGIQTNFAKQNAILDSIRHNRRTAVVAPNGVGKSIIGAEAVLCALCMYRDCAIVTTAGSNRQVKKLWRSVNRMYQNMTVKFPLTMLQMEARNDALGNYAYGFSTDEPGRFEGEHNKRILVILDEAKTIPDSIFEASDRLLTSGDWVSQLVLSSPGSPVGPFADCFGRLRDMYVPFHIEQGESPFVTKESIEDAKRKYGEESPMYKSMVLGQFAEVGGEPYIIPLSHVMKNIDHPPMFIDGPLTAGVDLAGAGGDENVIAIFKGNRLILLICWQDSHEMQTVGLVIENIRKYGILWENVFIDADGIGGPMIRRMEEQGYYPNRVYNGGQAFDTNQYAYSNAELWATAARKIELGEVVLKNDKTLISQLTSRKKKPRSDGRLQLESKEEAKRRGVHSPDRADAVVMAVSGRRMSSLRMDSPVEGVSDKEMSGDDWLKEHFRKAQADADQIRRDRGDEPWIP